MSSVFSTNLEPNPYDARDVLAFVLCPPRAFVPGGDEDEMDAVAELIQPAKEEAIRRWYQAMLDQKVS